MQVNLRKKIKRDWNYSKIIQYIPKNVCVLKNILYVLKVQKWKRIKQGKYELIGNNTVKEDKDETNLLDQERDILPQKYYSNSFLGHKMFLDNF